MTEPSVPQTYEDYLQVTRDQQSRDRDRFLGHNPHTDAPVFDARDGSAVGLAPEYGMQLIVVTDLADMHPDYLSMLMGRSDPIGEVYGFHDANGVCHQVPIDRRVLTGTPIPPVPPSTEARTLPMRQNEVRLQ